MQTRHPPPPAPPAAAAAAAREVISRSCFGHGPRQSSGDALAARLPNPRDAGDGARPHRGAALPAALPGQEARGGGGVPQADRRGADVGRRFWRDTTPRPYTFLGDPLCLSASEFATIEGLIARRSTAKRSHDWTVADAIKASLGFAYGVWVDDATLTWGVIRLRMRALSERDTKRQPPPTNLPPNLPPADRSHDRIIGGGTRGASSHDNGPNATVKKYTCADRTRLSTHDMAKIERLLAQRCIEKRRQQYAEADAIICELEAMGVWHDDAKLTYGTDDWKPMHAATPDGHPRYPGAAATPFDGHPPYPGGGGTLGGASSLDTRSSHWASRGGEQRMDPGLGQHRAVASHTDDGGVVGGGGGGGNWATSDEHDGMGLPPCAQPPLEHGQAERDRFASRGGEQRQLHAARRRPRVATATTGPRTWRRSRASATIAGPPTSPTWTKATRTKTLTTTPSGIPTASVGGGPAG